jgi:hypothetical protein
MTSSRTGSMSISAERLAYWYLRLNGFLTIQNFIVHPETGSNQRTDADVLGVRFPYRAELSPFPMEDDQRVAHVKDRLFVIMAEVKRAKCQLNGPWTESHKENVQRVLRAMGPIKERRVNFAAKAIYTTGVYSDKKLYLALACFGGTANTEITAEFPAVPQILWHEVLAFVFARFRKYRDQKASHGQWDSDGRGLWDAVWRNRNVGSFIDNVRISAAELYDRRAVLQVALLRHAAEAVLFKPMIGMVFGREAGQLGLDQVAIGAGVDDGNLVVCFDRLQRSADASHEKFGVPTRVQAPNVVIGGFDRAGPHAGNRVSEARRRIWRRLARVDDYGLLGHAAYDPRPAALDKQSAGCLRHGRGFNGSVSRRGGGRISRVGVRLDGRRPDEPQSQRERGWLVSLDGRHGRRSQVALARCLRVPVEALGLCHPAEWWFWGTAPARRS